MLDTGKYPKINNLRKSVAKMFVLPTRTQRQFAEECDINSLIKKMREGSLKRNGEQPIFGDFAQYGDLQKAENTVMEANAAFMRLPMDIRDRFNQSPHQLVSFINDPANIKEAIKIGLMDDPSQPPLAVMGRTDREPVQDKKKEPKKEPKKSVKQQTLNLDGDTDNE